jgi:hypothetical protein
MSSPYFRSAQDKVDFEFISRMLGESKKRELTRDEKVCISIAGRRAPEPFRSQFIAIYDDLMAKEA